MEKGIRVLAKPPAGPASGRLREAAEILDGLVGAEEFVEFLTFPSHRILE